MLTVIHSDVASDHADVELPCHSADPDLWFAERPAQLSQAQRMCQGCPIRRSCLSDALARREPWGVWGGEIFDRGHIVAFKRGRGRPAKLRPDYRESTPA